MSTELQCNALEEALLTPSSVIDCYNNALKVDIEAMPVKIQGVYKPDTTNRVYNGYYYDKLGEEGSNDNLLLKVNITLREKLLKEKGKLISIVGSLSRKVQSNASLQILFTPTFILSVKETTVPNEEIRLAELTAAKAQKGFRGVKLLIKQSLFENRKPTVALLWGTQSVVRTEFSNALGIAPKFYNFAHFDTTFSNVRQTIGKLRELDGKYDMVALIRGGGSYLEVFSNPDLIEAVVNMKSAVISAVGHAEEKHHFKKVADLAIDTPTALGKFFSDVVEEVINERNKSQAVLREEVKKEFQAQIDKLTTQNIQYQELNTKLSTQMKAQTEENSKQGKILTDIQSSLVQKDKVNNAANERIKELTDKMNKAAEEMSKKVSETTNPLFQQINRLTAEAEAHSKELSAKSQELINNSREIELLRQRPQGITITKALLIAAGMFAAGLLISLMLF